MEFGGRVRADRMRFREPPRTCVRFHGSPRHEATTSQRRVNLPKPVSPGEEYRDVHVAYGAENRLREDPSRQEPN